jgi:CheY-like chemotaxis protein
VVAEDDDMVRALVRVTLENSGYEVLEASSGEAALRLCEEHPGTVDVLVTDMVMPGMGGRALADRLQASRPGLRVLYVSGYAESEVVDHGEQSPQAAFVQKPFTPEELALQVRALIDRPAPADGRARPAVIVRMIDRSDEEGIP